MAKIDHHVHTALHSPDSVISPDDLIERAAKVGLTTVVITEHDYQWEAGELADLQSRTNKVVVLSGAEISAREGHFLVYGLPDLSQTPPGITVAELLKVVKSHKAAIVAAHPFRWDQDFRSIAESVAGAFDACEVVSNNVTVETREKTENLLRDYPRIGATGSSDGHEPKIVGCYYSEFPGEIRTMPEFVAALHARKGRPRHNPGRPSACGPTD